MTGHTPGVFEQTIVSTPTAPTSMQFLLLLAVALVAAGWLAYMGRRPA